MSAKELPYFRFTLWAQGGQNTVPHEVWTWYMHFNRKLIPACIVRKRNSKESACAWAVYRMGKEEREESDYELTRDDSISDGRIMYLCHGFDVNGRV